MIATFITELSNPHDVCGPARQLEILRAKNEPLHWILVCNSFDVWFLRDVDMRIKDSQILSVQHSWDLEEALANTPHAVRYPLVATSAELPCVSILTVTRGERTAFLPLLERCIREQDYPQIAEWVIVNGSQSDNEGIQLAKAIKNTNDKRIRFDATVKPGAKIGALRNRAMAMAATTNPDGIWVWMDDDDYYPPTRVSHAVQRLLENPHCQLAATEDNIMYDPRLVVAFQFLTCRGQMFANSSLAMRASFFIKKNRRYCEQVSFNEESSLTNGFTDLVARLEPRHTVVQMTHGGNTVSKRGLFENSIAVPGDAHQPSMTPIADEALVPAWFTLTEVTSDPMPDIEFYCGSTITTSAFRRDIQWLAHNRPDLTIRLYAFDHPTSSPDTFDLRRQHNVVVCAERSVRFLCWLRQEGVLQCRALVGDVHTNVPSHQQLSRQLNACMVSDPVILKQLQVPATCPTLVSPLGTVDTEVRPLLRESLYVADADVTAAVACPYVPKTTPDMVVCVAPATYDLALLVNFIRGGAVPILGKSVCPNLIGCELRVDTAAEAVALADRLCVAERSRLEEIRARQKHQPLLVPRWETLLPRRCCLYNQFLPPRLL